MWAMSDDGIDPDGFPPAETTWGRREIIAVMLTPTGPAEEAVEIRTEHEMPWGEIGRALITVGEMILANGEPGVTSTGIIIGKVVHDA
jgi:hypothetical protein